MMPALPADALSIDLSNGITTRNGQNFILFDESFDGNRIICFGSTDCIQKLLSCRSILMDGTFKASPNGFDSLYTIHGEISGGFVVPLAFALLTGRSRAIYEMLLNCLSEHFRHHFEEIWNPGFF